jgi:hypothetical protein
MRQHSVRGLGAAALLTGLLALLPACSTNEKPDLVYGQKVSGRVTYKGEPVPYGFVLFFSHEKSLDKKTGQFMPSAFGGIRNGKYEIPNAPLGAVFICLNTDPDTDPGVAVLPITPGGTAALLPKEGLPPDGLPGGPPTGPPGKPPVGPPGHPPVGPPGAPPLPAPPPGFKQIDLNPMVKDLTAAQKNSLRAIHAKYGEFGKSPLAYTVKQGEQTFDLILD